VSWGDQSIRQNSHGPPATRGKQNRGVAVRDQTLRKSPFGARKRAFFVGAGIVASFSGAKGRTFRGPPPGRPFPVNRWGTDGGGTGGGGTVAIVVGGPGSEAVRGPNARVLLAASGRETNRSRRWGKAGFPKKAHWRKLGHTRDPDLHPGGVRVGGPRRPVWARERPQGVGHVGWVQASNGRVGRGFVNLFGPPTQLGPRGRGLG